jgi:hypothetical protein
MCHDLKRIIPDKTAHGEFQKDWINSGKELTIPPIKC